MKSGALVFLAAFVALSASWAGFVLTPQLQLGRNAQTNVLAGTDLYPIARPGLAKQGAEVYRANGCVYCHSQQVGQEGTRCDLVLTDAGTNTTATLGALGRWNADWRKPGAQAGFTALPQKILQVPTTDDAAPVLADLGKSGAKVTVEVVALGPDMSRGWGRRRTVAQDFLFDYPVQPGSRRIGPDLSNIGLRMPVASWHLLHLYAPPSQAKGSAMPPYRFLFETRKVGHVASPDALVLPAEFAPAPGYEIVPRPEAQALVAYLLSLHADAPLSEAPLTLPAPPTPPTNTPTATAGAK